MKDNLLDRAEHIMSLMKMEYKNIDKPELFNSSLESMSKFINDIKIGKFEEFADDLENRIEQLEMMFSYRNIYKYFSY